MNGFRPGLYRGAAPNGKGWLVVAAVLLVIFAVAALV